MFLVDAAAAREAIGRAPNSEIAFEVELHATDKNIDSSQPKGQPVSQTVLVPETGGPGAANAPAAEPFAQRPGTEAPNSHASEPGADAGIRLGRSEGTAAADTGSPSDQNDGFNSGPGARQPALAFSHDTAAASPKLTAEAGRAQQQPSTPAAQLESHFSDPSVANQQPARSLSMKIHSEEHGSANVILTDRAGQVHVTVRAADPSLTQSLRSELNSLAGGLEQQGFAVRVWHPSSGSSMDGDRRGHSAGSAPDDLSGQPQQGQQHGDAGRRNRPQPEWMEELD